MIRNLRSPALVFFWRPGSSASCRCMLWCSQSWLASKKGSDRLRVFCKIVMYSDATLVQSKNDLKLPQFCTLTEWQWCSALSKTSKCPSWEDVAFADWAHWEGRYFGAAAIRLSSSSPTLQLVLSRHLLERGGCV